MKQKFLWNLSPEFTLSYLLAMGLTSVSFFGNAALGLPFIPLHIIALFSANLHLSGTALCAVGDLLMQPDQSIWLLLSTLSFMSFLAFTSRIYFALALSNSGTNKAAIFSFMMGLVLGVLGILIYRVSLSNQSTMGLPELWILILFLVWGIRHTWTLTILKSASTQVRQRSNNKVQNIPMAFQISLLLLSFSVVSTIVSFALCGIQL